MLPNQNHRFWRALAPFLSGAAGLAFLTFVCFRIGLNLSATAFLYLIVIVLVSLQGAFLVSAALSLLAVGLLAYYFAPPIFSLRVSDPFNAVVIVAFWITSAVVTHLVSRRRKLTNELIAEIEERKWVEEALRKSEDRWRNAFENNPTMYFMVDTADTILSLNPFGAEQLGYTTAELAGHSVLDLSYEADRETVRKNLALCLERLGQSLSWELRKVRKDGSVFWVRETARATLRTTERVVLIACEDITERRSAEEKIRQQELELRQLIDLAPQHVAVLTPDGSRLYLNRAGLDYHALTLEQWQKADNHQLYHPDDWARMTSEAERLVASGSRYETELRMLGSDGKYRWFLFRIIPAPDGQGVITRWFVGATDIEDRRQAEQRTREEIDKALRSHSQR